MLDLSESKDILQDANIALIRNIRKTGSSNGAINWLLDKIESGEMELPDKEKLGSMILNDTKRASTRMMLSLPGRMFAFPYIPKNRAKLKYYDVAPLIITLPRMVGIGEEADQDTITGLNLHYIEPDLRADLINKLLLISNRYYGIKQPPKGAGFFRIEYELLKSMKFISSLPCIRNYSIIRIVGKPVLIPSNEWGIAAALPFQDFVKRKDKTIWQLSRIKIREFIRQLGSME